MPRRRWRLTIVVMSGMLGTACPSSPPEQATAPVPRLTRCEDPRPELCTADYNPVCGLLADGTYKTYSNGCSACADAAVSGHRPGACE